MGGGDPIDHTTSLLADYVCRLRFADLPPDVVHQVKRSLIDAIGCGVGAFHAEPAIIARRLARRVASTPDARILGTASTTAPDLAAFANSVMVRYLDCSDSYITRGSGHPSDMISSVLAAADADEADGPSVITGIVIAYEVFARLCDEAPLAGWDQGIFASVGAACGISHVMGLDHEQTAHAISLAIVPNLPLGVTRVGELSMWKGCAVASGGRAAVFAAQLAREGMTGPVEPFEGERGLWAQAFESPIVLDRLGGGDEPFRIGSTSFKYFPSQIHTQGPIQLAIELREQVPPADIAEIRLRVHRIALESAGTEPEKWDPQSRETADHSLPYLIAVALQDGAVTPASFVDERVRDPALRPLMGKLTIREDPEYTRRFPDEASCRLEITSTRGQTVAAETRYPKGHLRNPLSDVEVEAKFHRLTESLLPHEQAARLLAEIWSLESAPNLSALFDRAVIPNR
jgi:2-methylcitrate dehydratase